MRAEATELLLLLLLLPAATGVPPAAANAPAVSPAGAQDSST